MSMTTAQLRNMAMEAEKSLDWKGAAAYWDLAISRYPESIKNQSLSQLDIQKMQLRRADCLNSSLKKGE